ncbi:hypothetical protein MLD38_023019 [Melastoma candidum]|uniref:Uncharacterized protein n=1 Tax=Melastoma candidum TaxID=119954 RepID=A0ACB9QL80_9MYRT|nr:hypothetical protein MLD38_023019 [Melastoma candidum]
MAAVERAAEEKVEDVAAEREAVERAAEEEAEDMMAVAVALMTLSIQEVEVADAMSCTVNTLKDNFIGLIPPLLTKSLVIVSAAIVETSNLPPDPNPKL